MSKNEMDWFVFGVFVGLAGMLLVAVMVLSSVRNDGRDAGAEVACGKCDSVKSCGGFECRAGVEGWQVTQ